MGVSVPFLVYQLTDYCFKSDYNHICVFACCCICIGYPVGYSTLRDQVSNESHLKSENYGHEVFSIVYCSSLAGEIVSLKKRATNLRICPVAGCRSCSQRKLSQNMDYKHPEVAHRKAQFLRRAKRVPRSITTKRTEVRALASNKPTSTQFLSPSTSADCYKTVTKPTTNASGDSAASENEVEKEMETEVAEGTRDYPQCDIEYPQVNEEVETEEAEGTRHYPRYKMEHPMFLQFQRYLTGVDGGARSKKTALEMSVDISKFLYYASGPSCLSPCWERLTDQDQLLGYIGKLKRSSVGPEGQLSKLDAFTAALRFFKVEILSGKDVSGLHSQATRMLEVISGWKGTLLKERRNLRQKRLQELSCEDLSLEEVTALIECTQLWRQFDTTCTRAKRGETLSTAMLNQCSICLAASVLYKNWQRPGAVVNATVQEFEACKLMSRNEKASVYIMSVKEHKTAKEGYARLVLDGIDYARIVQYAGTVRKCLNPNEGSNKLLLLSGGRSINSLSSRIQSLSKSYGLVFVGNHHAVETFDSMENLRGKITNETESGTEKVRSTHSKPLQKRRLFSPEENSSVKQHFGKHIAKSTTPSLAECKSFTRVFQMNRSPKDIQDKVKNIIKYNSYISDC